MLSCIPQDFPNDNYQSSLAGAQPKIALIEIDGKYYPEGNTPEQLLERYKLCEDLAEQGLAYCLRKIEDETVGDPTAAMIRLHDGLQSKDWCSAKQKTWIVKRVAKLGNWETPIL